MATTGSRVPDPFVQFTVEPAAKVVAFGALIVSVKPALVAGTIRGEIVMAGGVVMVKVSLLVGAPRASSTITVAVPAVATYDAGMVAMMVDAGRVLVIVGEGKDEPPKLHPTAEPAPNVPLPAVMVSVNDGVPASTDVIVLGPIDSEPITGAAVIVIVAEALGAPSGSLTVSVAVPVAETYEAGIVAVI